jgi:hypothetical protein
MVRIKVAVKKKRKKIKVQTTLPKLLLNHQKMRKKGVEQLIRHRKVLTTP